MAFVEGSTDAKILDQNQEKITGCCWKRHAADVDTIESNRSQMMSNLKSDIASTSQLKVDNKFRQVFDHRRLAVWAFVKSQ
jgi:hypothetical protein